MGGQRIGDHWAALLAVTEAAAANVLHMVGRGDKEGADQAAVDAMRAAFDAIPLQGTVVIGEGEMDEAPMLYIGEKLGRGTLKCDIAVDPVEGTTLTANGQPGAFAVLAAGPEGSLLHAPDIYMEKLCAGPAARGVLDPERPLEENVRRLAEALGRPPGELTATVLDRPRHEAQIAAIRRAGARVRLIPAGDVGPMVETCLPGTDVDLVVGKGGGPEGVLAAAAVRALGGVFFGRLAPENPKEEARAREMGDVMGAFLATEELVRSDDVVFVATSITESMAGPAPRPSAGGVWLSSLVVAQGTVRRIERFLPSGRP